MKMGMFDDIPSDPSLPQSGGTSIQSTGMFDDIPSASTPEPEAPGPFASPAEYQNYSQRYATWQAAQPKNVFGHPLRDPYAGKSVGELGDVAQTEAAEQMRRGAAGFGIGSPEELARRRTGPFSAAGNLYDIAAGALKWATAPEVAAARKYALGPASYYSGVPEPTLEQNVMDVAGMAGGAPELNLRRGLPLVPSARDLVAPGLASRSAVGTPADLMKEPALAMTRREAPDVGGYAAVEGRLTEPAVETPPGPRPMPRPGADPNVRLMPSHVVTQADAPGWQPSVGAARAEDILSQVHPKAAEIMGRELRASGVNEGTIDDIEGAESPQEMMLETNAHTRGMAGALANMPGQQRVEIGQSLMGRHAEQPDRLGTLNDRTFGPNLNRTQWEQTLRTAAQQESAPFWRQFDQMVIQPTPEIEAVLQRPTMRRALAEANRKLLDRGQPIENGFPVLTEEESGNVAPGMRAATEAGLAEQRVPTARAFQFAKEALDDRIGEAVRSGGDVRTYRILKGALDDAVAAHPNQEIAQVWRQARNTYRGPMELINARELGYDILRGGVHETEVPGIVENMSPQAVGAVRLGMRNYMDDLASRPGPTGLRQINAGLGGANQRKIAAVIGDDQAAQYATALEAEHRMHFTRDRVIGNSETFGRQAYQAMFRPPQAGEMSVEGMADLAGDVLAHGPLRTAARRAWNATLARRAQAEAAEWSRVNEDLGRIMTLQGPEKQAVRRRLAGISDEPQAPAAMQGGLNQPDMGRQPLQRQATRVAPTGRAMQTEPLMMGRESAVLEAGYGRATDAAAARGAEAEGLQGRRDVPGGEGGLEAPGPAAQAHGGSSAPPLEGLPQRVTVPGLGKIDVGPFQPARDAAAAYMRDAGMPYNPPRTYAPVDVERAKRIAQAYDDMKDAPGDPVVRAAYQAMADETMAQWRAVKRTGLKVDFIQGESPFEASPRIAIEDVKKNNHMHVFSTRDGFGESPITAEMVRDNPLLGESGETISGQPALINDIFRIVHDYFGHAKEGVGFRADGEENAWRSHASMYSPLARRAMTTETRGQNSWLNYGPHGEANRTAKSADTIYADQKMGLLPQWVSDEGMGDPHPAWISQRFPTGKTATENPLTQQLTIGTDAMRRDPDLWAHNVGLVKNYPNLTAAEKRGDTDAVARSFVDHVKNNLLYIHDSIPPEIRERSKLWYEGANHIANDRAQYYGIPPQSAAAVYAALSPQKDWFRNVSLGDRLMGIYHGHPDTPFTPEMRATGERIFGKPESAAQLDRVSKGTLSSLDRLDDRAMWLRIFDETYHDPSFHIVSPEGNYVGPSQTKAGANARVSWGSLTEIGKAIAALDGKGDVATISRLMGERHKIRNFYNNILDPHSPMGDVTIDTHAVAAGLLRPLSGNSIEVSHNFSNWPGAGLPSAKSTALTGVDGLYGLYADAYRQAAAERGILPREMQSITWEGVRGLFPDTFKTEKNAAAINGIWNQRKSGASIDDVRRQIHDYAGGFRKPDWVGRGPGAAEHEAGQGAADEGELSRAGLREQAAGVGGGARGRAAAPVPGLEQVPLAAAPERAWGGRVVETDMTTRRKSHYTRDGGTKERHCSTCTMFVPPHKCTAVAGFIAKRGVCDWFEKGKEKAWSEDQDSKDSAKEQAEIRAKKASGGRVLAHYVDRHPTEAQKRAGNYRKAHLTIHGLEVAIENPKGSTRSGVGAGGKPWSSVLPAHYGYIKRTEGADGDHVDVYLGPHHRSQRVWIVDQKDLGTGRFDEHKVFLGFGSKFQVIRTYAAAFSDDKGRERIGGIRELSVDELKNWLKRGDTTKPAKAA